MNMELNDDLCLEDLMSVVEPIKLSVQNTVFYVNKKTNVVGCKLYFDVKGPSDVITALKSYADYPCCEVTAEAHLNPDDNFDVEVGKKIARAKAESMAYRRLANLLNRIAYRMLNVLDSFDDFMYKADSVVDHNNTYLATF